LSKCTRFTKDNRLLPRGFGKSSAQPDIAVRGEAAADPNFNADGDRVRYSIPRAGANGPVTVEVTLAPQPLGFPGAHLFSISFRNCSLVFHGRYSLKLAVLPRDVRLQRFSHNVLTVELLQPSPIRSRTCRLR
jgi:hypothetical protein